MIGAEIRANPTHRGQGPLRGLGQPVGHQCRVLGRHPPRHVVLLAVTVGVLDRRGGLPDPAHPVHRLDHRRGTRGQRRASVVPASAWAQVSSATAWAASASADSRFLDAVALLDQQQAVRVVPVSQHPRQRLVTCRATREYGSTHRHARGGGRKRGIPSRRRARAGAGQGEGPATTTEVTSTVSRRTRWNLDDQPVTPCAVGAAGWCRQVSARAGLGWAVRSGNAPPPLREPKRHLVDLAQPDDATAGGTPTVAVRA